MTPNPQPSIERSLITLAHGITLSLRSCGPADGRKLVFLHGFPEAAFVWDGLLTHFAKPENGGFRCVAPNLRGFEQSSAPADVSAYRAKHLVQDIAALIDHLGGPLHSLIAHDWGGAVAWNLANQRPDLLQRLVILNSPHPGTFLRELQNNPVQQAASAYMNFLAREDAAELLAEDDFRRMWPFFTNQFASVDQVNFDWLTPAVKDQYREVWSHGLVGGCNYYRASPLRPPTSADAAASQISLPDDMLTIQVPTQVIWGMQDHALHAGLLKGLERWVPHLQIERLPGASHWLVHEQPAAVAAIMTGHFAR
jgi:pimeloyl-ACP methyl ester carboxylesterase